VVCCAAARDWQSAKQTDSMAANLIGKRFSPM